MNKVPSALQLGVRRGGLEIRQFARQRESVVFTLLFPVILLAIFGSVFQDTIALRASASVPGALNWTP